MAQDADEETSALIAQLLQEDQMQNPYLGHNDASMEDVVSFMPSQDAGQIEESDDEWGSSPSPKKVKRGRISKSPIPPKPKRIPKVKQPPGPRKIRKDKGIKKAPVVQSDDSIYNNGKWTEEEHRLFLEAFELYGRDWKQHEQHLKTRHFKNIKSHAQKHFIRLWVEGQELPPKVKETGMGYTLSGNPLDPTSAACVQYSGKKSGPLDHPGVMTPEQIAVKKAQEEAKAKGIVIPESHSLDKSPMIPGATPEQPPAHLPNTDPTTKGEEVTVTPDATTTTQHHDSAVSVPSEAVSTNLQQSSDAPSGINTNSSHGTQDSTSNAPETALPCPDSIPEDHVMSDKIVTQSSTSFPHTQIANEVTDTTGEIHNQPLSETTIVSTPDQILSDEKNQKSRKRKSGDEKLMIPPRTRPRRARAAAKNALSQMIVDDSDPHRMIPCQEYSTDTLPMHIVVSPSALILCDFHAHLSNDEIIGFLAGKWDDELKVLHIEEAIPCQGTLVGTDHTNVEMHYQSELQARDQISNSKLSAVGWYHSHPQFQPDPSLRDIENQLNYQRAISEHPFVGAILGTYDPRMPSAQSAINWFHVNQNTVNIPRRLVCTMSKSELTPQQLESILEKMKVLANEHGHHPNKTLFSTQWRTGMENILLKNPTESEEQDTLKASKKYDFVDSHLEISTNEPCTRLEKMNRSLLYRMPINITMAEAQEFLAKVSDIMKEAGWTEEMEGVQLTE